MTMTSPESHAARLLEWYDRHRRTLPWRAPPGQTSAPYIVWLSEIMLQQTTVATVGDYFHRFVKRWPTIEALAAAPIDDVLSAWAGVGGRRQRRAGDRAALRHRNAAARRQAGNPGARRQAGAAAARRRLRPGD